MYTIKLTMDEAVRLSCVLERVAEENRLIASDMETSACREYFLDNADLFQDIALRLDRAVGIGGV